MRQPRCCPITVGTITGIRCSTVSRDERKPEEIQTLAGHPNVTMTARYAHLDDSALRAAVDMLP